jgi:hypothetical protein
MIDAFEIRFGALSRPPDARKDVRPRLQAFGRTHHLLLELLRPGDFVAFRIMLESLPMAPCLPSDEPSTQGSDACHSKARAALTPHPGRMTGSVRHGRRPFGGQ